MATVVGVDLGSYAVKILVSEGKGKPPELRQAHVIEGADPYAVLAGLLQEGEVPPGAAFFAGWPGELASLRQVTMPFADADRIAKTLPFELEGVVPFEMDDMQLAWRSRPEGAGARVMAAMAPKEGLGERLDALASAGADPKALVVDAEALGALASGPGVQAVLDIGHRRTLVALVRNGDVVAARALDGGGATLTEAIQGALGLDRHDAEAIKHQLAVAAEAAWEEEEGTQPGVQVPPRAMEAVRAPLNGWLADLRATLVALEDESGVGIDELLLVGGGSRLGGLPTLLGTDLGVPVRRLPDPEHGLALALTNRAGKELNLRHGEFAFKGDVAFTRAILGYSTVGLVCFLVAASVLFVVQRVRYANAISEVEAEIVAVAKAAAPDAAESALSTPSGALAVMAEVQAEAQGRLEAIGDGNEPPTLTLLKGLSEAVPPHEDAKLDVKELTITAESLTFKAETAGYEDASEIEKRLQAHPLFGNAKKGEEKKLGEGVSFSVTIPLGETTTEEEG